MFLFNDIELSSGKSFSSHFPLVDGLQLARRKISKLWWLKVIPVRRTEEGSSQARGKQYTSICHSIVCCFRLLLEHLSNALRIDSRLFQTLFHHCCSLFQAQTIQHAILSIKLPKIQFEYIIWYSRINTDWFNTITEILIPITAWNAVISPNFLVWKFCGKA